MSISAELTKRVLFNTNRLRELAAAFQRTGNEKAADELYSTAYDLEKAIESTNKGGGQGG